MHTYVNIPQKCCGINGRSGNNSEFHMIYSMLTLFVTSNSFLQKIVSSHKGQIIQIQSLQKSFKGKFMKAFCINNVSPQLSLGFHYKRVLSKLLNPFCSQCKMVQFLVYSLSLFCYIVCQVAQKPLVRYRPKDAVTQTMIDHSILLQNADNTYGIYGISSYPPSVAVKALTV